MKTEWSDLKGAQVSQEEIEYFDSQEKNIFKNAKFGNKFITKRHGIALFIKHEDDDFNSHPYILMLDFDKKCHAYNSYGTTIHDTINIIVDDGYDIKSRYQEPINEDGFAIENTDLTEEIVINNHLDKPCELYKGDKMIGTIYNSTALNDVLAQLYLKEKGGIDVSEYYIMFEGQKLKRSKNGRLIRVPYNFFNTDKENLAILFHLDE